MIKDTFFSSTTVFLTVMLCFMRPYICPFCVLFFRNGPCTAVNTTSQRPDLFFCTFFELLRFAFLWKKPKSH